MRFFSTRGSSPVSPSQAILRGLAPDGGLYVPESFPQVSLTDIQALADMDYCHRAAYILSLFLTDFSAEELLDSVTAAYGHGKFEDDAPAPVKSLRENTWIMELFHGPTLAFKDMALQLLPHLTTRSARKNGETREISILVATSGDTGKAALEGFSGVAGTSCTVFYPKDGVSPVQQRQMTTTQGANTHVIAVEGNFDDTQTGVKQLFASAAFNEEATARGKVLSSANSINFGRLVPQVVYYFSAYAEMLKLGALKLGDPLDFVVPTGNFGNILAGYYALRMGLPVGRLLCASNRNNILTDFFTTGAYDTRRDFYKTASPSMDILVSSNLERLLYEACGRNSDTVAQWMKGLTTEGHYAVPAEQLAWMREIFGCGCCNDEETKAEIARTFREDGYVLDTHTAVASHVLRQNPASNPTVIVSTASPYKFAQDVLSALTEKAPEDAFAACETLSALTGLPVPKQVAALQSLPVRHKAVCAKEGMWAAVWADFDAVK